MIRSASGDGTAVGDAPQANGSDQCRSFLFRKYIDERSEAYQTLIKRP
jgi:hypothetical protein